MLGKNLRYYRLKKNLSKRELASIIQVSPMAITHYENDERKPSINTIKALANALDVRVADFLASRDSNLSFTHDEFRKGSRLSEAQQQYIREFVEEYMSRFFSAVDSLGGEVLPIPPLRHSLALNQDPDECAAAMRNYLSLPPHGPVGNLVELLENIGILVCFLDFASDFFSGMNGTVNGRPYIVINQNMSPERTRSTIAHEVSHFAFEWPAEMADKEIEETATAISGAFLFPAVDARRELGIHRSAVSKDMSLVCEEYGISMYLLVKRAMLCGIISESAAKSFYIYAGKQGWKRHEPVRTPAEVPLLFSQLVFRAVSEGELSAQKGAELLHVPRSYVVDQCFVAEC